MLRNLRQFTKRFPKLYSGKYFHTTSNLNQNIKDAELSPENDKIRTYLDSLSQEFYNLRSAGAHNEKVVQRLKQLSSVVEKYELRNCVVGNIKSLKDMENEKDEDMKQLVDEERKVYTDLLNRLDKELIEKLLTISDHDNYSSLIFEVNAGVGGSEAMLFAQELFEMYCTYIDFKGWDYEIIDEDHSDIGGLRHASLIIYGNDAFRTLIHEAGVHRVQRVPATEKSGRIHTSTVSVAAIPRSDDIQISISEKDLKIETKRASGAGGQHVNTTDSAVRIVHLPTGLSVESQTDRSQIKNKEIAIKKLQSKLYQAQLEAQQTSSSDTRKSQVGTKMRNEKIRTYNFPQDRITDHRITKGTTHNLKEFLEGGQILDTFINQLIFAKRKEDLMEILQNIKSL